MKELNIKKVILNLEGTKYFSQLSSALNPGHDFNGFFLDKKTNKYHLQFLSNKWSIIYYTSNPSNTDKLLLIKKHLTDIPYLAKMIQNYKKYLL